ncbi:PD40 domain-containing protein [candidate division WOR-3 bacterium]|nr:PD40 domain-containing protein [candidate division WOR-3 bacterium]
MKMSRFVIWGGVVIAGALLLSCDTIQGDLRLISSESFGSHSPVWTSDGKSIYFVVASGMGGNIPYGGGPVWRFDLGANNLTQITEEEFSYGDDSSPQGDYILKGEDGKWVMLQVGTWEEIISYTPPQQVIDNWGSVKGPKFSYESNNVIYYSYCDNGTDSVYIHRVNLEDITDERILTRNVKRGFAPGPGDTLIAFIDTIYNLNNKEVIPVTLGAVFLDWNPTNPNELLVSTTNDKDMYLFDIQTQEPQRINAGPPKTYNIDEAKFSPDGDKIVFTARRNSDGLQEVWLFESSD